MGAKVYKYSLASKIAAIKEGESIVVFGETYKNTMRYIGSMHARGYVEKTVTYKKAIVVVDDVLTIGCLITRGIQSKP